MITKSKVTSLTLNRNQVTVLACCSIGASWTEPENNTRKEEYLSPSASRLTYAENIART